MDDTTELAGML